MSAPEIAEAEVVPEEEREESRAIVPAAQTLGVAPTIEATELVARLDRIQEAQEQAMQENVDYGVIPGAAKPSLFKPGAEKLGVLFQLDIQPHNEKQWGPDDHLTVISHAEVFHAPTGARLGAGEGVCTTRERKYAYRKEQRVCPQCGEAAVIKGKAEYGGGWLCFKKKDGCGAKWDDGSEQGVAFETQEVGEIENPDIPDLWNTVVKMAQKRARVDAVLAVTGASAIFTQDVEDGAPTEAASTVLPEASAEQRTKLHSALTWLLPDAEAKAMWGSAKEATGGELTAPIAELLIDLIERKQLLDGDMPADTEGLDEEQPD